MLTHRVGSGEDGVMDQAVNKGKETWITRKKGELDFHLTQALTGHRFL